MASTSASPRIVVFANYKGGAGKTTLAHHLAAAAAEQGQRVLAVDTDEQGDLYRRLAGLKDHPEDRPPVAWGLRKKNCLVIYSPGEWALPDESSYDLIIVDSAPARDPSSVLRPAPAGPIADVVVVPIDGIDAALNANDTIARSLAAGVKRIIPVRNGTSEGGRTYAKEFRDLGDGADERVDVCPVDLPRAPSLKRTSLTGKPAWREVHKDNGALAVQRMSKWLLKETA